MAVWNETDDELNLSIKQYHTWTGDNQLCSYVASPDKRIDVLKDTNIEDTFRSVALNPVYRTVPTSSTTSKQPSSAGNPDIVQASSSGKNYHVPPSAQLYVHVISYAVVTSVGDIITNRFKFVPNGCKPFLSLCEPLPAFSNRTSAYNEIFVTSQSFESTVYDRMVEVVPHLAPFVGFLRRNPTVSIPCPETEALRCIRHRSVASCCWHHSR